MAVVRCPNGHYYDDVKHGACPHCPGGGGAQPSLPLDDGLPGAAASGRRPADDAPTVAYVGLQARPVAEGDAINAKLSRLTAEERTVGFFQGRLSMEPVVGWLVCLEGPERGRDFRLHAGQNFVGRSYGMDVVLTEDGEVSRERHCSIIYEPQGNLFYVVPGEGTATSLNGGLLKASASLEAGDVLLIGGSTLTFVPFCREGFRWL